MIARHGFAAALILSLVASAYAQPRGHQPPAMQPKKIEGVVEGVMPPNILVVVDEFRQPWQVMIPPTAKVQVTGEAEADFLQPGHIVEFKAELDDHGALKGQVSELTIVSLSPMKQLGVFPPELEPSGDVGFGADFGGKKTKSAKRTGGKAGGLSAGTYRIVGKLVPARGGKLSVNTGRGIIPLEISAQPTIAVDFADYSVARKGDKVSIDGGEMTTGRPGMAVKMAQANEVKIELAAPLEGEKKKGLPPKPEAKKPAKKPKKGHDGGLPEPAEER